jgi:ribosomal protein S19E (S16A)
MTCWAVGRVNVKLPVSQEIDLDRDLANLTSKQIVELIKVHLEQRGETNISAERYPHPLRPYWVISAGGFTLRVYETAPRKIEVLSSVYGRDKVNQLTKSIEDMLRGVYGKLRQQQIMDAFSRMGTVQKVEQSASGAVALTIDF